MRLSLRLIVSLVVGLAVVSVLFAYYQVRSDRRHLRKDLEHRSEVLAEGLQQSLEPLLETRSRIYLQRAVDRFVNREHVLGVAIHDAEGAQLVLTPALAARLKEQPAALSLTIKGQTGIGEFTRLGDVPVYLYRMPLLDDEQYQGSLAILQDSSYIGTQTQHVWRDTFWRVLIQGFIIALTTLLIVRWSIVGPIARTAQWMRALRTGRDAAYSAVPDLDVLQPLAHEVTSIVRSLTAARAAAETEARLRDAAESIWTAERLAVHVQGKLGGSRLFVVSNREPYIHMRRGRDVQVMVPASGVVTAIEPILRTCDGTWLAHGSGDADRQTVDAHDSLRVPPEDPKYTLRRIWLSKEEEEGYYYGFANEGIWPLCHIAHTRPVFREGDWNAYLEVNQKFGGAVLAEMADTERPVVLVQDYHFALLPQIIKQQRPDARVAIFWHIPWPNPEAFSICPWQRRLLRGLLGADLIGFHIQSHCNNFLQTVDRALESRIEWEHFAVSREEHLTVVRPFPISVEYHEPAESPVGSVYTERGALLRELGSDSLYVGVGVDRVDYTKGILERLLALERLFDKYPSYRERFTFIQIGAPSRTHIKRYHDLLAEVEAEVARINWRFQTAKWKPIVYLQRQHSHEEIARYYRIADVCLVTSLHDGMNLVAKEYVAARQDEQGALILSCFAGACRELRDALVVNPYDIEQVTDAIHLALEMSQDDQRKRMRAMRRIVKENNVYRWAGNLIAELCDVRVEQAETDGASPATQAIHA